MLFGVAGRLGPRMSQIVGISECPTGRGNFGVDVGRPAG